MKKYFNYQFKKSILPFALLALACAVIYVLPIAVENYDSWNTHPDYTYVKLYTGNSLVWLALMSVAAPVFFFAYKMNKRSVDMYFSLPLSRTKIAAVHFICGFGCIFAAFTTGYLLGFLLIISKVRRLYILNYLWIYLASIIPSLTLYTLSSFLYTRANTIIDGIIFIVAGLFVLPIVYVIIYSIGEAVNGANSMPAANGFMPWTAFEKLITSLCPRLYGDAGDKWTFYNPDSYGYPHSSYLYDSLYEKYTFDVTELVGMIAMTALAIDAAFGLFFTEKKCKAENCGQISESIFGYKTLIPLYLLSLGMVCITEIATMCMFLFAVVASAMVYRRTIKFGKKYAMLFAIYVAVSILCGILVNLRHFK